MHRLYLTGRSIKNPHMLVYYKPEDRLFLVRISVSYYSKDLQKYQDCFLLVLGDLVSSLLLPNKEFPHWSKRFDIFFFLHSRYTVLGKSITMELGNVKLDIYRTTILILQDSHVQNSQITQVKFTLKIAGVYIMYIMTFCGRLV